MVDTVLLVDAATGNPLCEIPLTIESYSFAINGAGGLSGTMSVDHPTATVANFEGGLREITVIRDDVPVWNGPVDEVSSSSDSRELSITAREASFYFEKRTVEVDKHYNMLPERIINKVWTYVTTKTDGGSINADVPRFSLDWAASAVTQEMILSGAARHTVKQIVDKLQELDATLEYRVDYATGSTRQTCHRTVVLGAPLGSTLASPLLTESVLRSWTPVTEWGRVATRVHEVGATQTVTKQNTGSIADGVILLEEVFDRSDTSLTSVLNGYGKEDRRKHKPPITTPQVVFTPSQSLPFGFCHVGDTVTVDINDPAPLLCINATRRVTEVQVSPNDPDGEKVSLTLNSPLDETGE